MAEDCPIVLLVEDNASLATVFTMQLENADIGARTCHLTTDALEELTRSQYALVLLDLQLPDRDGLELLSDIRRLGIETPVIVVTSDASVDRAVDAMRMGAQDYLVKPVTPERLLVTVQNALELSSFQRNLNAKSSKSQFAGAMTTSPPQPMYWALVRRRCTEKRPCGRRKNDWGNGSVLRKKAPSLFWGRGLSDKFLQKGRACVS